MKKPQYKITTFKGLDSRLSKSLKEEKKEMRYVYWALYEVLNRYNKCCYKNCWKSWWDKFERALLRRSDWHNPILDRMYDKLWVDFKRYWYISLYWYDKMYEDLWYIYRVYLYKSRWICVHHIFDKTAIPNKLKYSYPKEINKLIVKWEYDKLEKAIDYFCSNIKLDFSSKVWTDFINILDPKLQKCIDEYRKLKKESTTLS